MAIEIGSLVVRGSFGRAHDNRDDAVSEDLLKDMMEGLRREMRDEVARAAENIERRLRET